MLKYAKIINGATGLCAVGEGTNISEYISMGMSKMYVQQSDIDGFWYIAAKCPMKTEEQKAKAEQLRLQELSMTRSDFFDGTIKAFGLGQEELEVAIEAVLAQASIEDVLKKVALNNYKNALNFYRKHDLFTILSGIEIPVGESSINIGAAQWDRFFDETDKKNPEAWRELLPGVVEEEGESNEF